MNERPRALSEILRDEFDKANRERPVSEWMEEDNGRTLDPQIRTIDVIRRRGPATDSQP